MSGRFRRLSLPCAAIALGVALSACSNPNAPSAVAPARTNQSLVAPRTHDPRAPETKHWPAPHPDGGFGHEDPAYPPEPWQCPPGYGVVYNGWNFVCDDAADFDREMPRPEGYPEGWKPSSHSTTNGLAV
jgi:hypothetical protein